MSYQNSKQRADKAFKRSKLINLISLHISGFMLGLVFFSLCFWGV